MLIRPRALLTHGLLPLLGYIVGYAALTWPAITRFGRALLCDEGDGLLCYWNLWWIRTAVVEQGTHPWFTDRLYWPHGVSLIGQTLTPFNGFTGIALGQFLEPTAVHNTLIVAAFALGGWGCFLLAWHLSRCYWGSLFAGAAFTFSHYHFAHAVGHMQLVTLQWVPFFVLAFLLFLQHGTLSRGVLAAACLLLVALSDFYYTLYSVLIGATLVAREMIVRRSPLFLLRPPHVRGTLAFVVLALATTGSLAGALVWTNLRDPFNQAHHAADWCMDLLALFVPGGAWRFHSLTAGYWQDQPVHWIEGSVYLGLVPMLAALAGLFLVPRDGRRPSWVWVVLAVGFGALALGPQLHALGKFHPQVLMPYTWLEMLLPPLKMSGVPVRMAFVPLLCTALLAAHGLMPLLRRVVRRRILWPVVLGFFVFEIMPRPQVTAELAVPETVWRLVDLPPGAVHGWMMTEGTASYALWHQTVHGKPVTAAYVSRLPTSLHQYLPRLHELERGKRFGELMDSHQIRYLVQATSADDEVELTRACAPVWRGREWTIWVRTGDPLARDTDLQHAVAGPHVTTTAEDELTLVAHITSPLDPGARFALLASRAKAPRTKLGGSFEVDLADDAVLVESMYEGSAHFAGNHGRFDSLGRATVRIKIPAALRADLSEMHVAAVTLVDAPTRVPRRVGPVLTVPLR